MRNHMLTYANHFKRLYTHMFQPLAELYGLSQPEIDILLFLHNNPELNTARDISVMRGIAKSNVSNAVESLRKRGCLFIAPEPNNRKLHRLILSPASREMIEALAACQERSFAVAMSGFAPEELEALRSFLKRADENVVALLQNMESKVKEM